MKQPVYDPSWPDDVKAVYRHDMQEIWDKNIARHVWNQYHNQLHLYQSFVPDAPSTILDVGCAQATLALILAERGHRVTAVDLRTQFLEYAKSRYTTGDIRFLHANILTDAIPDTYDIVFVNQLIEHIVYPGLLIDRARHLLKPKGRLVISTPNYEYVINTLPSYTELGDPKKWENRQFTADADGHFFAYRRDELEDLFRCKGFSQIRTEYFETPLISGHLKFRYLHRLVPEKLLRFADRNVCALPWIGRRLTHQLLVTGIRPVE